MAWKSADKDPAFYRQCNKFVYSIRLMPVDSYCNKAIHGKDAHCDLECRWSAGHAGQKESESFDGAARLERRHDDTTPKFLQTGDTR